MSKELLAHPRIMAVGDLLAKFDVDRPETVVFTNGCFDILHPGHVDMLSRAKDMGKFLIVGVNTDDSVRRLNKGDGRPINPVTARMFVLAHLRCVDAVVPFAEDTPLELITVLKPDILVKGGDWSLENIVGRAVVEGSGGRVVSLPLMDGFSSTSTMDMIRNLE
ncbi:MAG: D-glycero-beta-D-manno-heptose 1-phosphate adenylyltransferase [Desulfovibrio sp.]|nr:MAG: D-glycero-beta-D-manno-heptose 1-phosphate adenylyltransferase [Desulfovibrio sp.]